MTDETYARIALMFAARGLPVPPRNADRQAILDLERKLKNINNRYYLAGRVVRELRRLYNTQTHNERDMLFMDFATRTMSAEKNGSSESEY